MKDSSEFAARELFDVFSICGVSDVVISPGSRNAALVIAAEAREGLKKHIVADERTASFIALGMAIASQKPVVLVCTSGSALYNYAPAVAESYYRHIPLIVLSADRPWQWVDENDSQTLRQYEALQHIVKKSYDIPASDSMTNKSQSERFETEFEWYVNRVANDAFITATTAMKGPVHINVQFKVPFNGTVEFSKKTPRIIDNILYDTALPRNAALEIAGYLADKRILVVASNMLSDHKLNDRLREFVKFENVVLIAEPVSNLHLDPYSYYLPFVLNALTTSGNGTLNPEIVIAIGHNVISAELKSFIRNSPCEVWTLNDTDPVSDCFMHLSRHYDVSPARFFGSVASAMRGRLKKQPECHVPDYKKIWREALPAKTEFVPQPAWNADNVYYKIFNSIPESCNLFISNGMSIRYADKYLYRIPHNCWANRGVSGIEGTNATAFGASLKYSGLTILITGDNSFAYCPEILNMKHMGGNLRIILISNCGGDIFRNIETTRNLDIREHSFCADQKLPVSELTRSYGWNYVCADSPDSLDDSLKVLLRKPYTLLEVKLYNNSAEKS